MGLIRTVLRSLLGGRHNAVAEIAGVFRINREAADKRDAAYKAAALNQFGREFQLRRVGWFDRFIDGLNRLPRPVMALGTLALFLSAMIDPIWFAERMQGIALIPEPLWWLLGVIVSFYFGARFQAKSQDFQRSLMTMTNLVPQVLDNISELRQQQNRDHDAPGIARSEDPVDAMKAAGDNMAITDWRADTGADR